MSPSPDWDTIDRAVEMLEDAGLRDVRAHSHDVHTVRIQFSHDDSLPWMDNAHAYDSEVEINPSNRVVRYVFRLPAVLPFYPDAPEADAIEVALTAAAEPLPPGRTIEIVGRNVVSGDMMAPHIRGLDNPMMGVVDFATAAAEVDAEYYDRIL